MVILILLMNALAGLGFPTGKVLVKHMAPFFLTGIRLVACSALLFGFHFIVSRSLPSYRREDLWMFFKLSFFSFFLSFGLGMLALDYTTASKVSFFYNLVPFVSAIFSYIYFSEVMTLRKLLALCIGFLGFIPMILANGSKGGSSQLVGLDDLLLAIVILTYAYGLVLTRKLMKQGSYSATAINAAGFFVGGIMALITSFFFEPHPVQAFTYYDAFMFALAVISVVGAYNLVAYLLKIYTATFLSFVAFIMPFFAAFFSWILLGERPTWHYLVSTVAVVVGLYIFYKEEVRQGYIGK